MDVIGILLSVVTIVIIVGPIGGAAIIYRDNLVNLIIPPETPEFLNETPDVQYVDYQINASTNAILLRFNVTNPYNFNLTINALQADVYCSTHTQEYLGNAAVSEASKNIPSKSHTIIVIVMNYTDAGRAHIHGSHQNDQNFRIDLTNMTINIQGIGVEYPERITGIGPIPTS